MPPEYRVCAPDLKGRAHTTVIRRSGAFYAQSFEESPSVLAERGRCRQVAFFHMQEWKKRWAADGSYIDPAANYDTFVLSQEGIRPLALPTEAAAAAS